MIFMHFHGVFLGSQHEIWSKQTTEKSGSLNLAKLRKESRVKTECYQTPVGKKASEKMPKLAFILGQIGLKKAQTNQAELRQMVEEQKSTQGGGG